MENKSDRGVYLRSENAKNAKCFLYGVFQNTITC